MKINLIRSAKWVLTITSMALVVLACQKETSAPAANGLITTVPSTLKVYLTDDQNLVFDKVFIDI